MKQFTDVTSRPSRRYSQCIDGASRLFYLVSINYNKWPILSVLRIKFLWVILEDFQGFSSHWRPG